MESSGSNKAARIFASAFATSLAEALSGAIKSPASLKVLDDPDLAKRQGQPVHVRLAFDGALRGECFIEFYEPQAAELAAKILGRPAAAFGSEDADALAGVISSAMAGLARSLSAEFGEIGIKVELAANLAFGGMYVVPLALAVGGQTEAPVLLYFDAQLMEAWASQPGLRQAAETRKLPADPLNLRLVMDVELNVSLRFGQRQLPLRDVLELTSGSVIELDRQVDEPVELLLDGKVIARGEAVIVDGNYGLRVTEVPQPMASHFGL